MGLVSKLLYLYETSAPAGVALNFVINDIFRGSVKRHRPAQSEFRASLSSFQFSSDWFTNQILYWLLTFEEYKLHKRDSIDVLEIGSWEGLSSLFILQTLKNVTLTCVDTWEHLSQDIDRIAVEEVSGRVQQVT